MESACIGVNNLPDEILLIIFQKLSNVEVLYSLIGVNKRFNRIAHDSIFTSSLTLMKCLPDESVSPLPYLMLGQLFSKILPEIHEKIKRLNIESFSMQCVLRCANYPNVKELGLYNVDLEIFKQFVTNRNNFLNDTFRSQIISLTIGHFVGKQAHLPLSSDEHIFMDIFTIFTNLQCLNFVSFLLSYKTLSFKFTPPTVFSSNLLELHVRLDNITDCLYVLDGRFDQLRRFYVHISAININYSKQMINQGKLPNLKCFWLGSDSIVNVNNECLRLLLHRMLNLEELDLFLTIFDRQTFFNGNHLKELIKNMTKLNKFTFNILTITSVQNQIGLPSNEDIHYTFRDLKNSQIISSIEYVRKEQKSRCHFYSYPYLWKVYNNITNSFSGGLFRCVRVISVSDERPFEHEFFLRISQSFPFLKKLTIVNDEPQKNQQCRKSNDDNESLTIIQYPFLTKLDLLEAHDDYVEQFLLDTKTCLPNNVHLIIFYLTLKKITNNFTRNETRINASKVKYRVDAYDSSSSFDATDETFPTSI